MFRNIPSPLIFHPLHSQIMTFDERRPALCNQHSETHAQYQLAITSHAAAAIAHKRISFLKPITRTFLSIRTALLHTNGPLPNVHLCCSSLFRLGASRCFLFYSRWVAHPFSRPARSRTIMVVYVYHYCMRYSSFHFVSSTLRFLPFYTHPCHTPTCTASHQPLTISYPYALTPSL